MTENPRTMRSKVQSIAEFLLLKYDQKNNCSKVLSIAEFVLPKYD